MHYKQTKENIEMLTALQDKINHSGRRIWERFEEQILRNYFYFNKSDERRVSVTCSFGQTLALDSNGNLYPCAIKKADSILGNFLDEDFRKNLIKAWKGCFYKHTIDYMSKCSECDVKLLINEWAKRKIYLCSCWNEWMWKVNAHKDIIKTAIEL